MPLHPKSKIKLEDDLKLGSAAKAASLPGMGAGASTIRDLSGGPADVTASGVTSNISDPVPETPSVEEFIIDERDGYKVVRVGTEGSYGTNLVGPDGLPATGGEYFVNPVTGRIQTRE